MRRAAILAVLLLGAQQEHPVVKDYPKDGVFWSTSWLDATDEAEARNAPIYVVFHKDGSDACATMANAVYRNRGFIEKSRRWVNLIAHQGKAHDVDAIIGGKPIPRCNLYWGIECGDHHNVYEAVKVKIDIDRVAPTRVFLDAEAKLVKREEGGAAVADLIKAMDKIYESLPGEKIDAVEYRKRTALIEDGRKAFKEEAWQKSIKAFTAAGKGAKGKLKAAAEDGLLRLQAVGERKVSEAWEMHAKVKDKDYRKVKRFLGKIVEDFKGLRASKSAQEMLDRIN